jgi:hypothetical protein
VARQEGHEHASKLADDLLNEMARVRMPAIPTAVQAIPGKTQRPARGIGRTHRKVSPQA